MWCTLVTLNQLVTAGVLQVSHFGESHAMITQSFENSKKSVFRRTLVYWYQEVIEWEMHMA
jgi:hypothetical protein